MIEVRRATLDDVTQMSAVQCQTWKSAYKGIFSQRYLNTLSQTHWVEGYKRGIQAQKNHFFVALVSGEVVGLLVCGKNRFEEQGGEIYVLYVLPDLQRKGVGEALMKQAYSALSAYATVDVHVVIGNSNAKRFYEKQGFVDTGHVADFELDGGVYHTHVMRHANR